jgi:hypothetical protein
MEEQMANEWFTTMPAPQNLQPVDFRLEVSRFSE